MSQLQSNNQLLDNKIEFMYKVIYCSSQDPDNTVFELVDQSASSQGWQSKKFCSYPQEIIV